MVDRLDIDALLIGSLYGELSSTEEARLSAHLESHPADRTALANLTRAREVVRESRILQVQFDPPQSVSALLMQEAVRRAPKSPKSQDEQSWFQRFMRTFIAHPAMAAAATLVLVIGVASTVYMKTGDNFAKATKDDAPALATSPSPSATSSADQSVAPTEQPPEGLAQSESGNDRASGGFARGSGTTATATTDDYKVKLDDDEAGSKPADRIVVAGELTRELAAKKKTEANELVPGGADRQNRANADTAGLAKESVSSADDRKPSIPNPNPVVVAKPEPAKIDSGAAPKTPAKTAPQVAKATKPAAPQKTPPRLEVTTPTQAPKDFSSVASSRDDTSRKGEAMGAGAGGRTVTDSPPGNASPPPAPPPPPPPAVAVEGKEKKAQEKAATELAWAKERHGRVIAAVKAGKCELAASIAVEIANRNSAYYATNVADDRYVKPCAQYINAQREREAERSQRAKSTQRRAADEAPAPAPNQSTK
jgi:hypothetical protein